MNAKSIRHRGRGLVVAIAAAAMVAACGSQSGDTGNGDGSDKSLTIALPAVPNNLDIQPYGGPGTSYVLAGLSSTLFTYDTSKVPGEGCDQLAGLDAITGQLVDTWSLSGDRKSIKLTLKDQTSANGNKLTAEDVKWSIERAIAIASVAKTTLTQTAEYDADNPVTVVDEKTAQLNLKNSLPIDTAVLTHPMTTIYDSVEAKKHATGDDPWANKWMQTNLAVFGPWKLDSFTPGDQVVLVPNPNFTGPRGNLTKVTFKGVPDDSTRAQLIRRGTVQFAVSLSYSQFSSLDGAAGVTAKQCVSPTRDTLILNLNDPALSKVEVRQAISMAIDRKALIQGAYRDLAKPAVSGVSGSYPGVSPQKTYTFDVAKAKQLLADAGYPNGFPLELTFSTTRVANAPQSAVLLQTMLKQIGIDVTLNNVAAAATFADLYYASKYQAVIYQEPPAVAYPYYAFKAYNTGTSGQNTYGFKNAQFDQLVQQLGASSDAQQQTSLINQLADLSVDTMPEVYLTDDAALYAYSSSVTGLKPSPYGPLSPVDLSRS